MSFLKKIFKKKPGGTALGNLLRGASSAATGGVLGQGLNKIEAGNSVTNKQILIADSMMNGETYSNPTINLLGDKAVNGLAVGLSQSKEVQGLGLKVGMAWVQENILKVLLGLTAVGYGVYYFFIKKKKKSFGKRGKF